MGNIGIKINRNTIITFFIFILLFAIMLSGCIENEDGNKKQITYDNHSIAGDNACDIWYEFIVYYGDNGVTFYNLNDNTEIYIAKKVTFPYVYDKHIIWQDRDENNKIYLYNILTKDKYCINNKNARPSQENPSLYEDTIVWIDLRHDSDLYDNKTETDIYLFNISTGEERRVTFSLTRKMHPDIYKEKIIWRDCRDYEQPTEHWSTQILDISTNITIEIEGGHSPRIWENNVFYMNNKDGSTRLYVYDLTTAEERKIQESTYLDSFDVYNDKIVWESSDDIYLYDLSNNKLTTIEKSDGEYDTWSPAIWGNKIIWASNKDGNANVYMYTISDNKISDLEPATFYISITALIIILILVIIILIRLRRKKQRLSKKEKEISDAIVVEHPLKKI